MQKTLNFIIAMLLGAIIATAGFLIYFNVNQNRDMQPPESSLIQDGEAAQPPGTASNDGEASEKPDGDDSFVPEMPDGEADADKNGGTPPEIPSGSGNSAGAEGDG